MKTILSKLSSHKAQKELKPFTLWAVGLSGISLFIFWFLGVAGFALGARALLLTFHKGNKDQKDILWYRAAASLAIAIGLVSIAYGASQ